MWTSPQQLDPLAGVTARLFSWIVTAGAFATATALTVTHRHEYHEPALLVMALAALAAACIVMILSSSPRRAPFTWRSALVMHVLCLTAVVLEAGAQWGTNTAIRSDWGPLALALLVMVTGCFRPAVEILLMTVVSSGVVAATTIAGAAVAEPGLPPVIYAGLTAGPLLAAGAGAASLSAALVARLLRWREGTRELRAGAVERMRARVRQDLHDERLAMIEHEIGPFLREVIARGETDAATAEQTARLAEALRHALVDEADGVWLDDVVAHVHDPGGLAAGMDGTERAAIEAACAALVGRQVVAVLERSGRRTHLTLSWDRGGGGRLSPELQAMLRHTFPGARIRPVSRRVDVEFDGSGSGGSTERRSRISRRAG